MEYPIGIEMAKQYLSYEVAQGAMKLVRDVMLVQPGECVVISADTSTDRRVVEAVAKATYAINAIPVVIYYATTGKSFEEPVKPVAEAVANADVWIEFAYYTVMHSPSFQQALANGVRYTCLCGMDVTMLANTIAKVDTAMVIAFGDYLSKKIEETKIIVVKDNNGTDLHADKTGRRVKHSGQRATRKGFSVMLSGQTSWCPLEETINGKLVFDAATFPPASLGKLSQKIYLTLENGRITKIEGGSEAETFKNWLENFNDPNMFRLAHYSLGFNPGVTKATGRIVEDERIFGCIEFGFGSQGASLMGAFWNAASHTDGVVSKPTIILDNVIFEENGVYIDPTAREFCRKLGVEGY